MSSDKLSVTVTLEEAAVLLATLSHIVHQTRSLDTRLRLQLVLDRLGRQWNEKMAHVPLEDRYVWPREDVRSTIDRESAAT